MAADITNIKTMQGDVGALPFEEGSFDYVHVEGAMLYFRAKKKY